MKNINRSAFDANGLIHRTIGISYRTKKTVVSPIKEMALIAEKVPDAVSIGWGLPSFETPNYILEGVKTALNNDKSIGKYPDIRGISELRMAISDRFLNKWKVKINPDTEILVTVGAQQALFSTLITIIDPGDEVILICPVFPSYIDQIVFCGGIPIYVNLDEDDGWKLNIEKIKTVITYKTKAIILNYPSNPTGSIISKEDLVKIANLAVEKDFFVITDETYRFLVYDDSELFNLFSLPELKKRLIGCYSFSKEYAMTGWRVGYLCAEPGIVQEILKIHDASVITTPRISQVAACIGMKGPQDEVEFFRNELLKRREIMATRLDHLSHVFSYHKPVGAYYYFPKIINSKYNSFVFALKLLNEAKVVTVPGGAFGKVGENHLRFCFGVSEKDICTAFDRLDEYFK